MGTSNDASKPVWAYAPKVEISILVLVPTQNSKTRDISMMQAAQDRQRHGGANRLSTPEVWCVFIQ
jgi:hypothetical protein